MSKHESGGIVAKFGGTSNATLESTEACFKLAEDANIVVVSAPGKTGDSDKVTNLLLDARSAYERNGEVPSTVSDEVSARYADIIGVTKGSDGKWIDDIAPRIISCVHQGRAAASTLGERLQAEIWQKQGYELLDPVTSPIDLGDDPGLWRQWLEVRCSADGRYVLPGNTTRHNGALADFERGGSDISAGLVAFGTRAGLHRNYTDGGALSADPSIIDRDRLSEIDHLLYVEGRELGRNGTGLVHAAAMIPLMIAGIPTHIISAFDPDAPITVMNNDVERARERSRPGRVVAMSLMRNVAIIDAYVPGMAEQLGGLAKLELALRDNKVTLIDSESSGADSQRYIVDAGSALIAETAIQGTLSGSGEVQVTNDRSLIAFVGHELGRRKMDLLSTIMLGLNGNNLKAWQREEQAILMGNHVLRVTVNSLGDEEQFNYLHQSVIEGR